jgi:hypothetical protein
MALAKSVQKRSFSGAATENRAATDGEFKPVLTIVGPPISLSEACLLLGVSKQRISQLTIEGWIQRPLTWGSVAQGFISFLRASQSRPTRVRADNEVQRERARKLWLENEEKEAHLVSITSAMAAIDDIFGVVRGAVAGLPSRITADPVLRRSIEDEIDAVLDGLAERLQQNTRALRAGVDLAEADPKD